MADQTTSKGLLEPILEQGIQNSYFFNGRLLTASDLQTDQAANRLQHRQLGQGLGAGIISGFDVSLADSGASGTAPMVSVSGGLAVNRAGQAVTLPLGQIQVMLARQLPAPPTDAGLFANCAPPRSDIGPVAEGAYVLAACPVSGFREKAPLRSFSDGSVESCDNRYAVEGVEFRLVELRVDALPGIGQTTTSTIDNLMTSSDPASLSLLRNLLAHLCFGTEQAAGFLQDPLIRVEGHSPYVRYGALDALRDSGDLTDCDVPIALLYWTNRGVQFVDMWSVRRRPFAPPTSTAWPLPIGDRRRAEAEAMFLQFEEHIQALVQSGLSASTLASLQASDYFRYLPAAGILPLAGFGTSTGFSYQSFANTVTHRAPVFIEGAKLEPLLRDSLSYPPFDLGSGEMIWLYLVRQNIEAIDRATTTEPQAYLIFTSGHVPYHGEAQFDVNRWSYSNYT